MAKKGEFKMRLSEFPHLLEEWNYEKNVGLDPEKIGCSSRESVWWKCKKCLREWKTRISHRTSEGTGCRRCSSIYFRNKEPISKSHPHLLKEWDYDKNTYFSPDGIGSGSERKVWWKCIKGHSFLSAVYGRANGNGCPYCSGKMVNDENCLETNHPKIAKEWDYEKNVKSLTPKTVTRGSTKKVWWKCVKGHSWRTAVGIRTSQNTGCPYCCGRLFNSDKSLSIMNSTLAKEWHPTKNGKLTPKDLTFNSKIKVWWKCKKGHEWKTKVSHRNGGSGCPFCDKVSLRDGTVWDSKIEALFYLVLKKNSIPFISHGKYGKEFGRKKYDFYLPEFETYIETTSFRKETYRNWERYIKRIEEKRSYVENILEKKFIFIQYDITTEDNIFLKGFLG